MGNKCIILIGFALMTLSCIENKATILETPFVTIVKLIDEEQALNYENALQYIDVVQVYSKLGSTDPVGDWKKVVDFHYKIGKDNKFTNNFGYAKYDIEETINDKKAIVSFKSKDANSSIKAIIYGLEKRQNNWIVISIDYLK